ncbi:MAG: TolC family protein [Deltaproteobacteria bacterium]|nr:TolC family protein [Deltaproteobacteria bacterium]
MFKFAVILSLLVLASLFPMGTQAHASGKELRIGILIDVERKETPGLIRKIETEIKNLLEAKYTVKIEDADILRCDWSVDCIERNYQQLVNDARIDIIIGLGFLNGAVLTRRTAYPKPVIVVGVIDTEIQKTPITPQKTSGVHNLTYVMLPKSLDSDLETFHRLYPYRRIGLIEDRRLMEVIPADNRMADILAEMGVSILQISVDSIDAAMDGLSEKVDAVIIGTLNRFEEHDRARLIEKINAQNLPSFALMGAADLRLGALAATGPITDYDKIFRRLALNIERILDGEDPAELPLMLDHPQNLFLNPETARRIGFSPSWDLLMDAQLVLSPSRADVPVLGLGDVIREALSANKALAAKQAAYRSKEADVALSKTELFPQLGISAGGTVIDAEHAAGGQAERTTSAAATVDQVIYSEQLLANVTIKGHELMASQYSLNQLELDTVQETSLVYFDILRALTDRRIRKDYLDLVKKNLDIARKRLSVGYAGAADVYRWESEIARAKNSLIEAYAAMLSAKHRLNQLLYRPIDDEWEVRDVTLSDNPYNFYPEDEFRKFLDNPAFVKTFADFLVMEARTTLPEIKEIDESIKSIKRSLVSYKKKRYLPDVLLRAQADRSLSRSGDGSEIPLPDDDSWQVGVHATWPIFEGGQIHTRTHQLRIDLTRLENQKADLIHNLEANLRNNVLQILSKSFNITLSRQAAEAGAKSLELEQDAYEKGLVSIVQLLDAQNAALTAELSAANAVYDYFTSHLNLERSVGRFVMLSTVAFQTDFMDRFDQYFDEKQKPRDE